MANLTFIVIDVETANPDPSGICQVRLRWTPDGGGARLGPTAEDPWASAKLACNRGSLRLGYQ